MIEGLLKQLGPVPEYPKDADEPRDFVVQVHFRGRSAHWDVRFALDGFAEGWTVSAAQEGVLKVPVLTLSQAEKLLKNQDLWKVDLETGMVLPREVRTTIRGRKRTIVRPGGLFAERKAQVIPKEWLGVEGVTPYPPDWPKTILAYWNDLPEEVKRELRKEGFDAKWAETALKEKTWQVEEIPVGATRSFPGVLLVIDKGQWVPGARKPWFFEYFLINNELFPERIVFRFVARTKSLEKAIQLEKDGALVLPPGEVEEAPREPGYWVFYTPEPWPYVLSDEAIDADWVPPFRVSALPPKLRKQVPRELQFWNERSTKERLRVREELVAFFEEKGLAKAEPKFKLFRQTYRGQIVIRWGPSTQLFWFLLDEPRLVLSLENDPRLRAQVSGVEMGREYWNALWELQELEPRPGTLLNPTKETPSRIELVEEGIASVMQEEAQFLRLKLEGDKLRGYFNVVWEDPDSPVILFGKARGITVKEDGQWKPVAKDAKKQIVYGVVLSPYEPDAHGDLIPPEEIENAAYRFLQESRKIGLFHEGEPIEAYPVESYIAPADFELVPGSPETRVRKGEWVLAVYVPSRELWQLFEAGLVTGFSIQGWGVRQEL